MTWKVGGKGGAAGGGRRVLSAGVVSFAVAAAICMAVGSALQHQAVAGEQGYRRGIRLLLQLAGRRRWLAGLAIAAVGALLHAAALRIGALAVVQPVLVLAVALALPVRELLERRRPSAAQVLSAAALAGGVALFVAAVHPSGGRPVPAAGGAAAVITTGVAVAAVCSVIAAWTRSGRLAGFTLGLGSGTLYGLTGGVLKATVHALLTDPVAAVTGWPLWALAGLGIWALILHQRAYTHAPLPVSLPVLAVANPLAGMIFGMAVFGETPASGPLAWPGQAAGLAVIVVSVTVLARLPAMADRRQLSPATGAAADSAAAPERRSRARLRIRR